MYIETNTILILSIITVILIGMSISKAITYDIKNKINKAKHKELHKNYSKLYKKHYEDSKLIQNKYYELRLEFIDRFPESDDIQWFSSEEEMEAAIDYHNNVAAIVEKRLKEQGLATDSKKLELEISEIAFDREQSESKRYEWYAATNKIADELKIGYSLYGYYHLPFNIDISQMLDGQGEYYATRTVEISEEGITKLLNKVAI